MVMVASRGYLSLQSFTEISTCTHVNSLYYIPSIMKYIVIDVEADGQVPGINSMVCFGAVIVDDKLDKSFYGQIKPISDVYDPEALAVSGFSREEHLEFDSPEEVMLHFKEWLAEVAPGRVTLISDNNQFDGMYMNYYFHRYTGGNPLGWSSRRIGDLFCGYFNDMYYPWKKHRKTKHTHHPVDDARGNAEALLYLKSQGFKFN